MGEVVLMLWDPKKKNVQELPFFGDKSQKSKSTVEVLQHVIYIKMPFFFALLKWKEKYINFPPHPFITPHQHVFATLSW